MSDHDTGPAEAKVRPKYRDLPVRFQDGEYRDAWSFYAANDNLGALAYQTAARRLTALESARSGTVINLTLALNWPDPPMFGRKRFEHTIFRSGRNNLDDRLDSFFPQASTQWDGFRHVQAREAGFFTGHNDDFEQDPSRLGIEHFAAHGIVGRGVLLDLSALIDRRAAGDTGQPPMLSPADLRTATAEAGLQIRPGDVLCIRTGWMSQYMSASSEDRTYQASVRDWPGLQGSAEMAELLWDWQVSAVAADNPAVEWAPGSTADGSLHRRMIALLGVPFGELFDFETLATACVQRDHWDFLFVSVPLNLPGGVGSPGNALAII
jgi:kynurenine formamidase